ncbi:MAG: T9SS type A sorting domain-containing protein [Chitinophagales bacterium]|nr:T9SS type A sorting domain-containing protein [Chitinophagales bacterium]
MRWTLIFWVLAHVASAQNQTLYFNKVYDFHHGAEVPYTILIDGDSSYVVLGTSLDTRTYEITLLFQKFDNYGNLVLQKKYKKPGYQYYTGLSGCMVKTHDGGYAFGGSIEPVENFKSDGLLVKFNAVGDTEFMHTYGDTAFDAFYGCIETSDHGFVLVGQTLNYGEGPNGSGYVVKTDSLGILEWQHVYGTTNEDIFFSVIQLTDSGYIFGGDRNLILYDFGAWLVRTDKNGNEIKEKLFDKGAYRCGGAAFSPALNNEILMYGCLDTTIEYGDYPYPRYIGKLDTNFNILWQQVFNDPIENGIFYQRQYQDGSVIAVGFQGDEVTAAAHGLIAKITNDGRLVWQHEYYYRETRDGAPLPDYFTDVQQTFDKGYVTCGFAIDSMKFPTQDIWLVKLDSNGCLQPGCDTIATAIIEVTDLRSELIIYPNPASDHATVLYNVPPNTKAALLQVVDLAGRLVKELKLVPNKHEATIDVLQWNGGIYICDLIVNEKLVAGKKLIIEK